MRLIYFALLVLIAVKSFAGITEPLVKWPTNEVRVCFLDGMASLKNTNIHVQGQIANGFPVILFNNEEIRKIQLTVQYEYTPEKTGIHFTGWKMCSEDPTSQVVIFKIDKAKNFLFSRSPGFFGRSSIGHDGVMDPNGYTKPSGKLATVVFFSDIDPLVVAHEFGHLSGLRHENINPTAKKDLNCNYLPEAISDADKIFHSTKIVTPYDSMSIMNTCNLGPYRFTTTGGALTAEDQETLRLLYKQK